MASQIGKSIERQRQFGFFCSCLFVFDVLLPKSSSNAFRLDLD